MRNGDILTLREASRYLRISPYALADLARGRKVPCFKVGRVWRFRRSTIERWAAKQESRAKK